MSLRDHESIVIEDFNGLWRRGDADSCPPDHFSEIQNISFIESGFRTRDGLDTFLAVSNPVRMYTFNTELDGLIAMNANGQFYYWNGTSTILFLTVADATDFSLVNFNNRAYISPWNLTGLDDFLYVFLPSTGLARKAGGEKPTDADGALAVANGGAGNVEAGIHIFGVVYETDTGFLTAIGPDTLAELTATGTAEADLTNIPVSPNTYVTKRHIVATKAIDPNLYTGNTRGYEFFFVPDGEIPDNTTTTLSVNFYDAELIDNATELLDLLEEIKNPGFLTMYHNRLVAGDFYGDISLVRVSLAGEPEAFDAVDGLLLLPNDGLGLQNGHEFRDILYIMKINQTFAFTDNGDVPSSWPMTRLDQSIGAGRHGICAVQNQGDGAISVEFLITFDYSGIYLFSGIFIEPELSYKIRDYWLDLDRAKVAEIYQFYNDHLHRLLYINLPDLKSILVGDYGNGMNFKDIRWSVWTFDIEPTTITLFDKQNKLLIGDRG